MLENLIFFLIILIIRWRLFLLLFLVFINLAWILLNLNSRFFIFFFRLFIRLDFHFLQLSLHIFISLHSYKILSKQTHLFLLISSTILQLPFLLNFKLLISIIIFLLIFWTKL